MTLLMKTMNEYAAWEGGRWLSANAEVADMLNAELDPDGFSPSDPTPMQNLADRVIEQFGGEVVRLEEQPSGEPGTIY